MKLAAALIAAALAVLPVGGGGPPAAAPAPAAFAAAPCESLEFAAGDLGAGVECGWLTVPETRGRAGGRSLRIAVVIARATGPTPAADPVLYIHGGPGIATLDVVPRALRGKAWPPIRARRDLIFFDARGVGRSTPGLCPALGPAMEAIAARHLPPSEDLAQSEAAVAECRKAVIAEGGDPAAYNADAIAADARDLMTALGYRSWNVFATSYGSLPAVALVRLAPVGVRALVVDSAFTPNAPNPAEQITTTAQAFAALQRRCDADPACRARYPDLRGLRRAVIARLDAAPLKTKDGDIDGADFAGAIWTAMVDGSSVRYVPELLRRSEAGDEAIIRRFVAVFGDSGHFGGFAVAQSLMANCHDIFPPRSAAAVRRASARYPDYAGRDDPAENDRLCAAMGAGHVAAAFARPVRHAPPTLILFGEFDPATSDGDAAAAARFLGGSRLLRVAGASHAPFYADACTRRIVADVYALGRTDVDAACLAARHVPPLVDEAAFEAFLAELPPVDG